MDRMRYAYDGYHFSYNMVDVYNPFSVVASKKKVTCLALEFSKESRGIERLGDSEIIANIFLSFS